MKVDIDKMSIESLKEILKSKEGQQIKTVKKQIVSMYDSSKVLFEYEGELKDANLSFIDLRGCDLSFADLRGCDLRGSNLKDAKLTGCLK